MNKLVSRNPVQRFKEGKKIVKAQYSWGPGFGLKNTAKNQELKEVRKQKNIDTATDNLLKTVKKEENLLPSRNIVQRFKVAKAQKGLKTAPKAEDRYKNGVKDSVAYLGVPGKDKSYFGESIKRVTTPDNAKIQRQILFRHYPNDNDTIYREVPEHSKYSIFPIKTNIQSRQAFSYAKNPEYEVLKRRFNTAWNLAK